MHEFMSYEIFLASSFEDQIIDREKADVMSLALTVLNMEDSTNRQLELQCRAVNPQDSLFLALSERYSD
jgi:hypothetical protein